MNRARSGRAKRKALRSVRPWQWWARIALRLGRRKLMRRSNARSAVYLRAHAVVRLEEVACVCEQLPVGRVVYRFNRGNLRSNGGMRMFEMCLKFGLRAGRAHDQDGSRMRNGRGHALEKILVYGRMSAVTRIRLVVQVLMGMGALDDGGF